MYYSILACQSIGAAGLAVSTQAGIFGAATSIGGLAAGLFKKKKKIEGQTDTSNNDTPEDGDDKKDQEIKNNFPENMNSHGKFNPSSSSILYLPFIFHLKILHTKLNIFV